jgi:conjugal transfer pilus assembly protein TraV
MTTRAVQHRRTATALALAVMAATVLSGCASQMSAVGGDTRYACNAPTGSQCTSVSGVYANAKNSPSTVTPPGRPDPLAESVSFSVEGLRAPTDRAASPTGPASRAGDSSEPNQEAVPAVSEAAAASVAIAEAQPLRLPPRVLRLWVAPWEDADGDLHEASNVHVLIDIGRWRIEHVRPVGARTQDAVKPPAALQGGNSRSEAPRSATAPPRAAAPATTPQR